MAHGNPTVEFGEGQTGIDYGDFRTQVVTYENFVDAADPGARQGLHVAYEPLQNGGGLQQNEVAELVHMETQAGIEFEYEGNAQKPDGPSNSELRGAIGINLPERSEALPARAGGTQGEGTIIESQNLDRTAISDNQNSVVNDQYLQNFQAFAGSAYEDQANGPGGGSAFDGYHGTRHFRNIFGRGPVFDSNDDLTIATRLVSDDTDEGSPVQGVVRTHLIWDIAEVDDSGRRFSVPEM